MMVGTDGGGQAPGQSIHQEFDKLSKAGLSTQDSPDDDLVPA
jgi:hypothetical protein